MTWKRTTVHDAADADVLLNVSGAVSTHLHQAAQDDGQSLACCKDLRGLREDAEAAVLPSRLHRRSGAAWTLGSLGVLLLAVVIPVVRGGPLDAPGEPRATTTTDAADWTKLLPQEVASHMDNKVDPCDDLYAFSCGSWLKQTEIPADTSGVSLFFSIVRDENEKVMREVMEQGRPFVGELYDSCMNFSNTSSASADAVSVAFLSPVIKHVAAATSKSEVFQLAGNLRRAGTSFLTQLGVAADAREATMYALYASQTGLSLPDPQYYMDRTQFDSISDAFHAYVVELFSLVGWESHEAASQASSVIAFEQALAPLFVPKEELEDLEASYNRMSVTQAAGKYPLLFAQFMDGAGILENLVSRNASVTVQTPSFFERVEELVTGDSVTLDTLKAVLTYQYISTYASTLSEPFVQAFFAFDQALWEPKTRAPRWKVCLRHVIDSFPNLAGKYFALLRFDAASEQLANQLVAQIEASLQKSLMHVDWMDEPTRQGALEKLGNMATLIGYSNSSEHFPFELDGKAPLAENLRMIKEHGFGRNVARVGGRVDRNEWVVSGAEVNTYYQLVSSQVTIPAGILQPPFFGREQHPACNFGAIGSFTGHVITQGFDSLGRLFDGDGNLQDWWSNSTAAEFLQRTDCFVNQYNEFAVTSGADQGKVLGYVNGNYTLSENIADHGGLEFSFRAYQTYVAEQATELSKVNNRGEATPISRSQTGPDLPADVADKLFFISFAQSRCLKESDASMVDTLAASSHSPDQWRINGVARNSHDFARVFSCPAGSRMNPTTKCQLW